MARRNTFARVAAVALAALLLPTVAALATPAIDARFRDYYNQRQGIRVLGYPLTELVDVAGYPAQYFEKGRIEDHRAEVTDPNWAFMYGRLTAELMERAPERAVTGVNLTYADLHGAARQRRPAPTGFRGGVMQVSEGTWPVMFVPYDPYLRPAAGHTVPMYFWDYINRADLFPGGWLHDVGLPMTGILTAETIKNGERRTINLQAFERTVLTYDPRNPVGWMVERGNIGADLLEALGTIAPDALVTPAHNAVVTLPLHILARPIRPGAQVMATLRWTDGPQIATTITALNTGASGGVVVGNLDYPIGPGSPPLPPTGPATLELRADGQVIGLRQLTVLHPEDPNTQAVTVYWVVGETVQPARRVVPRTAAIGTAALEALLWGPTPRDGPNRTSALPTPEQVTSYPGRAPDWGPRVTLRSLKIENGVATADFSPEMSAYGGGSLRVKLIRDQISRTLLEFPSVREVRIAVAGQTEGVLEP